MTLTKKAPAKNLQKLPIKAVSDYLYSITIIVFFFFGRRNKAYLVITICDHDCNNKG